MRVTDGGSCVSWRLSSSHFLRPPFSSFTSSNPRSFSTQYAYAANQLLFPPYRITVVSGPTPAADRSSESSAWST